MNTFLPYPNFVQSAECLDWRRLGKQRLEAMQLLKALLGETTYARNHPACEMWDGYEDALIDYALCMCIEWKHRGYEENLGLEFRKRYTGKFKKPPWLGLSALYRSHQSNLKRKDPIWYCMFDVPTNLPYYWPTRS